MHVSLSLSGHCCCPPHAHRMSLQKHNSQNASRTGHSQKHIAFLYKAHRNNQIPRWRKEQVQCKEIELRLSTYRLTLTPRKAGDRKRGCTRADLKVLSHTWFIAGLWNSAIINAWMRWLARGSLSLMVLMLRRWRRWPAPDLHEHAPDNDAPAQVPCICPLYQLIQSTLISMRYIELKYL